MFQRISSLFFGDAEDTSSQVPGPKPCVKDAEEEGWLLVSLPGEGDWVEMREGDPDASALPRSCAAVPTGGSSRVPVTPAFPSCNRHRTKMCVLKAIGPSPMAAPDGPLPGNPQPRSRGSTPASPGSLSDCSCGPDRCGMDESWFVTPPPCFTAEGATAEASPMEDLLIEHPSMSVYVSLGNQSVVEEGMASLAGSMSRVAEPMPSAVQTSMPARVVRGAASKAGALAKVAQVTRVQRAKARAERRHLSRGRLQRQNRVREQVPRRAGHTRNAHLHQPCQHKFSH